MIAFHIPGSGVHTIQPSSALPTITDPVVIDGYTQPGASPNTNPIGQGSNAVLKIELDGSNAGTGFLHGLHITGANSTVRGLVINRFSGNGVALFGSGATGNSVEGNFIGTDVTGSIDLGNLTDGVQIRRAANNTIGGITAGARNIISGNDVRGISIQAGGGTSGVDATGNLVLGNFIGTDVTGAVALGNSQEGVVVRGARANTIGGTRPGARNIISGNRSGIWIRDVPSLGITGANHNLVQGNFIGTDVTGFGNVGNSSGVNIFDGASNNTVGGTASGAGNRIAFNKAIGVIVRAGTGNAILGNSILSNGSLGIDLGTGGVTPNDPGDGDTGANNLQNFPVLTSTGHGHRLEVTLNSTPNTMFRLEFFANTTCDLSGNGEGARFLFSRTVTTDGNGDVSFRRRFPLGLFITATATDPGNNTSEFSQCTTVL